ncbi:BTB/POZ domain-containing protein 8 [Camponotus floridanus]|uniref:BTB/POZ domain-containing protein 8 n=1 Tax=Camponotus floridanus TaxID=104421 RepID=E2AAG6_CAMFO|nr:BTB/POZ domain-containing protein 8 [Camponotus floridanus]
MAGGRSDKQNGNLDKTHQWLCHSSFDSVTFQSSLSDEFKKRKSAEQHRTIVKNINQLQDSILRIFTDSLYCDLNIIHGYKVIRINQCIVRARSPHLYEVLKPYFIYINKTIHCILDKPGLFHQIEDFVRLLYSNLDFSQEEQLLVEIILNTNYKCYSSNESDSSISHIDDRICEKCLTSDCNTQQHQQKVKRHVVTDASPTASEMADSGLETGSISPHENTTYSENSSTDLEVIPATTEYTSTNDDDSDRIRAERIREKSGRKTLLLYDKHRESLNNDDFGKSTTQSESNNHSTTCSSLETEHPPTDNTSDNAREAKLNAEEIFQYESQMLSEPFYESDCGSENESFEFIEPVPSASGDHEGKCFAKRKLEQKIQSDAEESESTTVETESDHSRPTDGATGRNSSSTSGYYFIDASTLNDEVDIVSTNVTKNQYANNNAPYFAFSPNYTDYKSSDKANNPVEEQSYKFTPLKTLTLQTGHERVAEFERELKLTEYLQPLPESRKIKRVDSVSEEKTDGSKPTEKESLAVEIKEADSGESAHPSPCPDNNTRLSNDRNEKPETSSNTETTENENVKDTTVNEDRRSSLIRRNTFELDSNDEKLSALRQEYERRQGNLIFQSAIPQYSGHRVDGDSICHAPSDSVVSVTVTEPSITFTPDVQATNTQHPITYQLLDGCEYDQRQTPQKSCLQSNLNKSCTIYPVIKSASDKSILDCSTDSDDASNHCSNSLPVTLNSILEKSRLNPIKRIKRSDETTPIISGGVSSSDYSFKPSDSPTVRRKTESTPIVSGGAVIMNKPEVKTRPSKMSSSMTAWVVDMSDCSKQESGSRNNSRNMSQSFSTSECVKKPVQKSSINHEKQSSLGFFVNLKDVNDIEPTKRDHSVERKERDSNDKSYCEFYVDISDKNNDIKAKPSERQEENVKNDTSKEGEKKNIFSMFIDLNDTCGGKDGDITVPKHRRSFSTIPNKSMDIKTDDNSFRDNSSAAGDNQLPQEQKREKAKPSVFMFIESDSPVVRRRTLSTSRPTFKRHSWNTDKTQSTNGNGNGCVAKELMFRKEHKRAHSVSMDSRSISKRSQAKTSSSSHSLSDAAKAESRNHKDSKTLQDRESNSNNMDTSSEDVFEFDVKDTPPNSHVEIETEEQLRSSINQRCEYKDIISGRTETLEANETKGYEDEFSETSAWEKTCTESTEGQTRKSETFDISSGSSGPSPDSDNHDYELTDLLNGQVEVSNVNDRPQIITAGNSNKISETRKSLSETIKKIESELKEPEYDNVKRQTYDCRSSKKDGKAAGHNLKNLHLDSDKTNSSSFVRLSDLDKTPIANHNASDVSMKDDRETQYRMSSSIPETSWIESKLAITRNTGPFRPVSRKLVSVMSTSLPSKQKSPLEDLTAGDCEGEGIISESDLSSMQSSMGRSGAEGSTEETETSSIAGAKPYNRLGEDLLRMFLEEINPDITIDVAGRHIRAHKCILSSRCQYFAAILSGGWIESAGNVISLQGYSYNAVHFALCHIYSGESNIPDSISIVELATLADMLCLEGLKEVIGYTLKLKYCHLFHKPCQICAIGVLECMPLAAAYGLDEVYRKSLRWITKHFVRIWPCKAFATLPRELMEKCYHQHIVHMSTDNVLQTMMDCDKLLATLPNVRWAEPVFRMVSNLLETSIKFLSENFAGVLGNENFQSLGREMTWNISRLEDNFLAAIEQLSPEQACKSYSKLNKMLLTSQTDDPQGRIKWGPLFIDFLHKLQTRVEKCLVRDAARAARTTTWLKMDLELRRRIQELACLVILPHETSKRLSRHSNFLKESQIPPNRSTINRNLDLKRVKMAISEHNDKSLKQVPSSKQTKKVFGKPKTDPLERKMQEDKQVVSETVRPKSWPNKIEVKSRYLEPRNKSVTKESVPTMQHDKIVQQRRKIMISSSDSSRTSSPAMKRAIDKKPLSKMKLPVKKDVKALSSDSLTEANASGRSGGKRDLISKSCGITRPESPSFKQKTTEIGLSIDSLETKNKPAVVKKKPNKMDTSMSTDSLMTEITATPKSNASNKLSPTLAKATNKTQIYDRTKKSSPPTQQRSPLTAVRRPLRSLESSTAASRSRAAAISSTYYGSPNLRRNLLDAAKTPDVPSKLMNAVAPFKTRQITQTNTPLNTRRERKETQNSQSSDSPSKKSSPKSSAANRMNKSTITGKRIASSKVDDKVKRCHNGEAQKQPTVGSRSGTFLKDEPTILKKVDIKSSQINT